MALKEFEVTITRTYTKKVYVEAEDYEDVEDKVNYPANDAEFNKFNPEVDPDDIDWKIQEIEEV